ncbi:MAG TPA: hypothetical protein VM120_24050 [Bryobacteraceae bacterium]|nr:hypothetical protein [Bryobacteraceae bacterium]
MLFRIAVMSILAVAGMGAGWKDSAFPNWSEDVLLQLVTDSPWAKPKTVGFNWTKRAEQPLTYKDVPGADHNPAAPTGSPVGGIGGRKPKLVDRADIIIRWASALPIRQAKALYRQSDAGKVAAAVGGSQPDYVLEIFGVPAVVAHRGTGSVESVAMQSVYLRTASGHILKPGRVEATLQGLTLNILVYFPRKIPITLADREVECAGDLQLFEFKEKFKLRSMVYREQLEL